jgi:hypothetical protein
VQGVPPGTTQGAFPALERNIQDLPSKEFFLKVLDRPHYPGEAMEIEGERFNLKSGDELPAKPEPSKPAASDKQVRNETAPAKVADAR